MNYEQKKAVVRELRPSLNEPNETQLRFMNEKAVPHQIYYSSPKRLWCTNCGHRFSIGHGIPNRHGQKETCPKCGLRLETCKTNKMTCNEDGYAMIAQAIGDWQILRYFYLENHNYIDGYTFSSRARFTYAPSKDCTEVMRIYINPTKKEKIVESLPIGSFPNWRKQPYAITDWQGTTHALNVCTKNAEKSEWRTEWMIKKVVPGAQILPYFRQRGVNARNITKLWTDTYMMNVVDTPYAETLLKMGQIRLANLYANADYNTRRYDRQIRIALRHGFNFEGLKHTLRDYWDYIEELRQMGMDDTNPKYLVPDDFSKAHTELSERVRVKREREYAIIEARREEEDRKRRIEREKKLAGEIEKRKHLFGALEIMGFGLVIKPLFTADEYKEEGKAMHHCVGGYWDNFTSLILSARDSKGERVETIEVDLKKFVIIQSRAVCNGTSKKHNDILNLVNNNMKTIKKMAMAS